MSSPSPDLNPNWYPPQPPQSGCGGTLLKGLGCGCVIVLVLCCGGGVAFYFLLGRWMNVSHDSAEIRTRTAEIATLDIPSSLTPKASLRLKVPAVEQPVILVVIYEDAGSNSTLMLGSGLLLNGGKSQETRQQFEKAIQQQGTQIHSEELTGAETKQEDLKINGETHRFNFTEGLGVKTHTKRIEVTGTFSGKAGTSLLFFSGSADKYSAETLKTLIESIH